MLPLRETARRVTCAPRGARLRMDPADEVAQGGAELAGPLRPEHLGEYRLQ